MYQPLASMLQKTGIADPTPQVTTEQKYLPARVENSNSTTNSSVERNITSDLPDKVEDWNSTTDSLAERKSLQIF